MGENPTLRDRLGRWADEADTGDIPSWMLDDVAEDLTEAIDTIDRLTNWKDSATRVLAEWECVFEALGRPGPLGTSKASNTLAEVDRLTAENERLREAMAAALAHCVGWHGSCCPCDDDDGPCMDDLLRTLDDQTERWLERAKADAQPGPKHAAPSPSTGEGEGS